MVGFQWRYGLLLGLGFVALFVGCGSDDSSSNASNEPEQEPEISSEVDAEVNADAKITASSVILDSAYDSNGGAYATVQFGSYIWTAENASSERNVSGSTFCYDDDEKNCDDYGRLYHNNASDACPQGFSLPTEGDWREAMSYRGKYPEVDSALNFPLGGYYDNKAFSLLGKEGRYLTADGKVARVKGRSVSFGNLGENDYVSVRCVRRTHIVATVKDLPSCDSILYYVMDKKSNYRCIGSRWVDDFTNDCAENGTYSIYNDSMYICKEDQWQLASISDSRYKCTDDIDSTTYLFNGIYYSCQARLWIPFDDKERLLGFCKSDIYGTIDTLYYKKSRKTSEGIMTNAIPYLCDSTGWREAHITDFFGICDSTRQLEEVVYKKNGFVCRDGDWKIFSDVEKELGVCTPQKIGVVDSLKNGSDYVCESSGWNRADQWDYLKDCTPERHNEIVEYRGDKFACFDSVWVELDSLQAAMGLCTAERQGAIDSAVTLFGKKAFICDNLEWIFLRPEDVYGACQPSMEFEVYLVNNWKYYCRYGEWTELGMEEDLGFCTPEKKGQLASLEGGGMTYSCNGDVWVYVKGVDAVLGVCTEERTGDTGSVDSVGYKCGGHYWLLMSADEYLEHCDSTIWGKRVHYRGEVYICEGWLWSLEEDIDWDMGPCTLERTGESVEYKGGLYVCSEGQWDKVRALQE